MADAPDYSHELSARRHALFNLAIYAGGLGFLLLGGWAFVPADAPDARAFLQWMAALGGFVGLVSAVVFVPLAIRGGSYRVTLSAGRLRVESPHCIFGRSFVVKVSDIARLVVKNTSDGPVRHEIHTCDGKEHHLDDTFTGRRHLPADELFAAIRRHRPDVPVVEEP